jgi:ABC-type branched-subunit amino acid transport system substrate-binding protein
VDANREGLSMRARRSRRSRLFRSHFGVAITLSVLAGVLAACSSANPNGASSTSSSNSGSTPVTSTGGPVSGGPSPGVTSTSVTVGQVDDLSAPLPGLFKGAEDGTKAYFAYVNSQGGVNGRKLYLDAQDSQFQGGVIATATAAQATHDFALVGGFSLLDGSEKPYIDFGRVPDVGFSLDPSMITDPLVYSAVPNPENYYPTGLFKYLKRAYPQAIKKVGIIWENATGSTKAAEDSVETAMKSVGFDIVYDHGVGPFDTDFLPDIITMKNRGVKLFFSTELPDNYAATLLKQFQQQNFKPINVEGAAYSNQFLKLAGSAANDTYIEQGYALYLGQDAAVVPEVKLFDTWMKKVDSSANFEIESIYGWTSAELFTEALRNAGNPPTREGLIQALNKVTFFDGGGLVPPSDPAAEIPSGCFLLAQVQNGHINRVSPTPSAGFYCGSAGYYIAPGYQSVVRPS